MKRAEGPQGCAAKPAKKRRVSNPTPYPSAHMMTAAIIFWRVDDGVGDDGVGGRCRGCAGVTQGHPGEPSGRPSKSYRKPRWRGGAAGPGRTGLKLTEEEEEEEEEEEFIHNRTCTGRDS